MVCAGVHSLELHVALKMLEGCMRVLGSRGDFDFGMWVAVQPDATKNVYIPLFRAATKKQRS